MIKNKQSNLLSKNWLRLHSGSGPSLKKSTPAPLLFSKIVKTPPESTPTLRLLYTSDSHFQPKKHVILWPDP